MNSNIHAEVQFSLFHLGSLINVKIETSSIYHFLSPNIAHIFV